MKTAQLLHLEYVLMYGEHWTAHVITFRDPGEAESARKQRANDPTRYACVRVTGPHDQQVPS